MASHANEGFIEVAAVLLRKSELVPPRRFNGTFSVTKLLLLIRLPFTILYSYKYVSLRLIAKLS